MNAPPLQKPLIRPAGDQDIDQITDIYNAGIRSGLGTFETRIRKSDEIAAWLETTHNARYPLLVVEYDGICVGFARLFEYRPRECYAGIAEFSIYLDEQFTGKKLGALLLQALLDSAKQKGFHKVLSRIFTFNSASRALCHKLGFREVGTYRNHGQLNGRWLDVVIVEYLIEPSHEDAKNGE